MDILIVSLAMLSGTLLGIYADFGRYGLLTAIQICQSNDQFIQTLRIAPWTHLGMLLACSAAIMFVQKDAFSTKGCAQHLCCLVAMFVGMWLIKIVPSDAFLTTSQSGIIASLVPLTYMWLAMSLAMATFFLITNMGKPYQPKEDTKND